MERRQAVTTTKRDSNLKTRTMHTSSMSGTSEEGGGPEGLIRSGTHAALRQKLLLGQPVVSQGAFAVRLDWP